MMRTELSPPLRLQKGKYQPLNVTKTVVSCYKKKCDELFTNTQRDQTNE